MIKYAIKIEKSARILAIKKVDSSTLCKPSVVMQTSRSFCLFRDLWLEVPEDYLSARKEYHIFDAFFHISEISRLRELRKPKKLEILLLVGTWIESTSFLLRENVHGGIYMAPRYLLRERSRYICSSRQSHRGSKAAWTKKEG